MNWLSTTPEPATGRHTSHRSMVMPLLIFIRVGFLFGQEGLHQRDGTLSGGTGETTSLSVDVGQNLFLLTGMEGFPGRITVMPPGKPAQSFELDEDKPGLLALHLSIFQSGELKIQFSATGQPQRLRGVWWLNGFLTQGPGSEQVAGTWLANFNLFYADFHKEKGINEAVIWDFYRNGHRREALATAYFYARRMAEWEQLSRAERFIANLLCRLKGDAFKPLVARLAYELGQWQRDLGFFSDGAKNLAKAAAVHHELPITLGEAHAQHALGYVQVIIGDDLLAETAYLRALELFPKGTRDWWVTRMELGWLKRHRKNYRGAELIFLDVLAYAREKGDLRLEHETYDRLGSTLGLAGRFEEGEKALKVSLRLVDKLKEGQTEYRAIANLNLAFLVQNSGRPREALAYADKALALYPDDQYQEGKFTLYWIKGKAFRDLGRLEEALTQFDLCLQIAEALSAKSAHGREGPQFFQSSFENIEDLFHTCWQLHRKEPRAGYDRLAFSFLDRIRARGLTRSVSHSLNQASAKEPLLGRVAELAARGCREIPLVNPALRQPASPDQLLASISKHLLRPRQGLMAYFLGETTGYWWLIHGQKLEMGTLPPKSEIERLAKTFNQQQSSPLGNHQRKLVGKALAQILFPRARVIRRLNHLYLLPDGLLHRLPFAALPEPSQPRGGKVRPLIRRKSLSHLPSASLGIMLRTRDLDLSDRPEEILIVADPVFNSEDRRLRSHSTKQDSSFLQRLPHTAEEQSAIKDGAGMLPVLTLSGFAANRKDFMNLSHQRFRLFHLATHAFSFPEAPRFSGLFFSMVDEQGTEIEGYLASPEISLLHLRADLAVLSACSTADGSLYRGEGMLGLARAFLQAGAGGVIASIDDVDDPATARLMDHFYGELFSGKHAARALQIAQRRLARDRQFSHPKYWANFILIGDSRKIF